MTTPDTDLATRLEGLWSDEGCSWSAEFDGLDTSEQWIVNLKLGQFGGNLHGANFAEYRWWFYGDSIEEALTKAVGWCEELAQVPSR